MLTRLNLVACTSKEAPHLSSGRAGKVQSGASSGGHTLVNHLNWKFRSDLKPYSSPHEELKIPNSLGNGKQFANIFLSNAISPPLQGSCWNGHLPQAEEMRPNIGWEGEEGRRGREQLERAGSCFPPTGDKLQLTTVVCLIFTSNKGGTLLENLHIVHFYQTHPPKRKKDFCLMKNIYTGDAKWSYGEMGRFQRGFIKCHEGL